MAVQIQKGGWILIFALGLGIVGYALKEYLVSLGIDAARLQSKSYGKERPVCAESDDSCWQQNRRGYSVISSGAGS